MNTLRVGCGLAAVALTVIGLSSFRSLERPPDSIENLHAFARLYGYVRYFHPSEEASRVDWDAFAVYGAAQVDRPMTVEELERTLRSLFEPIAPSVQIFRAGEAPTPPDLVPMDTAGLEVVAWRHMGGYYATRSGRPPAPLGLWPWATADVAQRVDAVPLRGRQVRITGALRTPSPTLLGDVDLAVAVVAGDGEESERRGLVEDGGARGTRGGAWEYHELDLRVPRDATEIMLHLIVSGAVERAWFDDVSLVVVEGDSSRPVGLENGSFEAGDSLSGWSLIGGEWGFEPTIDRERPPSGERSLLLQGSTMDASNWNFDARPAPGEFREYPLGRDLVARVPHALYGDDDRTYPEADPARLDSLLRGIEALGADTLRWNSRALRLGTVVSMWNALQHFYPYFDVVEVDWERHLNSALERARTDATEEAFLSTMNRMLAGLKDGHAAAWNRLAPATYFGPFMLERTGDEVVVAAAMDGTSLLPGDVIVSVDGEPIDRYMEREMAEQSGSPQKVSLDAMRTIMRGEYGSETSLEVSRGGQKRRVAFRHHLDWFERPTGRPESFTEVAPGIVYVYLWTTQYEDIESHMDQLAAARGLVLDMRGYSGTFEVLGHLTADSMISGRWERDRVIFPDRRDIAGQDTSGRWWIEPREPRFTSNVAFLIDARAMSSAETFLALVEHYDLGPIVGRPTAGTNGNVVQTHLPGGFSYAWTGMRVRKHDGSRHHLVGIRPTHPVERTIEAIREGRDEDIERALEILGAR